MVSAAAFLRSLLVGVGRPPANKGREMGRMPDGGVNEKV